MTSISASKSGASAKNSSTPASGSRKLSGKTKKTKQKPTATSREDEWTNTTQDVGEASPKDDVVRTKTAGQIITDASRAGMFLTFAERDLVIAHNVVFFAPQATNTSSADGDTVTSFQAQMAMSLTSPKNEIVKIFCDYAYTRGYSVEENGASSVKASKVKYGVRRLFQLRLGLNECQERVAIITFSIETLDSPASVDSSGSSSSSASSDDDDDNERDDGAAFIHGSEKPTTSVKLSLNSGSEKDKAKKHDSNSQPSQAGGGGSGKKSGKGKQTPTIQDRLVESHRNKLTGGAGNRSVTSTSEERQMELMRVAQSFGGGSGYV